MDFDVPGNSLWWGTAAGTLRSLRLADGLETEHGGGYMDPVMVALGNDGLSVWVVESAGAVLRVLRADAGRAAASLVAKVDEPVAGAAEHGFGQGLLVVTATGRLVRVGEDGSVTEVAGGFVAPSGVSLLASTGQALVTDSGPAGPRLRLVDLDTGVVGAATAAAGVSLAVAAEFSGSPFALTTSGPLGSLKAVGLAGQAPVAGDDTGAEVLGLAVWGSLVMAATDGAVVALEWDLDEGGPLAIDLPLGPLFVGGYARIELGLAAVGMTREDVDVLVEEGPELGSVSAGIEADSLAGATRLTLCAGPVPGEYHVVVIRRSDGTLLGRRRFRTTRQWYDEFLGPPVVTTGEQQLFVHGKWGGGPTGPQNVNILAAPEQWRVLLAFVDLKDQRYGANIAAETATLTTALYSPGSSAKDWYEETSLFNTAGPAIPRGTTLAPSSLGPLGPLHLDLGWGDAFEASSETWLGWDPKESLFQAVAGAVSDTLADAGVGRQAKDAWDALVIVIATASNDKVKIGNKDLPAKFVWPQAGSARFFAKDAFSYTDFPKPLLVIPDRYPTAMPADEVLPHVPVLCHELGHTLGLEDLYNTGDYPAEIAAREIGPLDFMDSEFSLPHPSLGNKLRLGWVHPDWIRSFDFAANPTGDTVTLHAADSLTRYGPPAGRKAGIEVRVENGWNYYFEHRRTEPGHLADQLLNETAGAANIILGTDVRADGSARPSRPVILRLGEDLDHDGPILWAAGKDYEETDTTNPNRQHDFRLVLDSIDAADPDAIKVRVEYVAAHRPQLQINPAPGRGDWKSPDIDLTGPGGDNRILKGHRHQVVVRVRNLGVLQADAVRIGIKWLPFTTSAGPWTSLTDPLKQDIAPGAVATFVQDWDVPKALKVDGIEVEHFCVRVDVDAYVDPREPGNNEVVVFDNWAQSNFDTTTVGQNSPSQRTWTGVDVANPLSAAATYLTVPEQDSEWFRTYVGNAWVRLRPGEHRMVEVGYESLAGDHVFGAAFDDAFKHEGFERPACITFNSFVRRHQAPGCQSPAPVWGAQLSVRPGIRTEIRNVRLEGEVIWGTVTEAPNGMPVPTGGDVNVVLAPEADPTQETVLSGDIHNGGEFQVLVPGWLLPRLSQEPYLAEAVYLGNPRWAFARSGMQRVN
ncbi:hypothetical protein [Streptomyces sp. NPDC005096]|uniref:hypothetical protein n=1 Tax=Streptomyces sp. NPDC005096 TaxID=3154559 RepID=UPI0033B5A059